MRPVQPEGVARADKEKKLAVKTAQHSTASGSGLMSGVPKEEPGATLTNLYYHTHCFLLAHRSCTCLGATTRTCFSDLHGSVCLKSLRQETGRVNIYHYEAYTSYKRGTNKSDVIIGLEINDLPIYMSKICRIILSYWRKVILS